VRPCQLDLDMESTSYLCLYEALRNSESEEIRTISCTKTESVRYLASYVCKASGKDLELLDDESEEALTKRVTFLHKHLRIINRAVK